MHWCVLHNWHPWPKNQNPTQPASSVLVMVNAVSKLLAWPNCTSSTSESTWSDPRRSSAPQLPVTYWGNPLAWVRPPWFIVSFCQGKKGEQRYEEIGGQHVRLPDGSDGWRAPPVKPSSISLSIHSPPPSHPIPPPLDRLPLPAKDWNQEPFLDIESSRIGPFPLSRSDLSVAFSFDSGSGAFEQSPDGIWWARASVNLGIWAASEEVFFPGIFWSPTCRIRRQPWSRPWKPDSAIWSSSGEDRSATSSKGNISISV